MERSERCNDCLYRDSPVSITCMLCGVPVTELISKDDEGSDDNGRPVL